MRHPSRFLCLIAIAAIAGCSPANSPKVTASPATASTGTILLLRTVAARSERPAALRAVLQTDGGQADSRPTAEFIVRADDGAVLSIVQENAAGFRAGDRVAILRTDQTRLARPE